jgi:hypothetical protein
LNYINSINSIAFSAEIIMKTFYSNFFNKVADSKYPKSETEPTNPWAVCNKSTGGKKKAPAKFERCVQHVKEQNREENMGETKDVRGGRSFQFRSDEVAGEDFDRNLRDEMSGQADVDKSHRLDDIWLDALRKQKAKEKAQEPVFAFVVKIKNK